MRENSAIRNKKFQKRVDWDSPRTFLTPCSIFPENTKENYGRARPSENALQYLQSTKELLKRI